MKKYIKNFVIISFIMTTVNAFSQITTHTFKPNHIDGKDAVLKSNDAKTNFGYLPELAITSTPVTVKGITTNEVNISLLKFDGINSLPGNSCIVSATLKLYGIPSSSNFPLGNYVHPDFGVIVSIADSPWIENTVTYNTMPSINSQSISIPGPASQWNWDCTINSTLNSNSTFIEMLELMRVYYNYGFVLTPTQISPDHYSGVIFASSDYWNSQKCPELIIEVETPESDFNINISSTNRFFHTFTAANTYTKLNGTHTWEIYDNNLNLIFTTTTILPSFDYIFPSNTSDISYTIYHSYGKSGLFSNSTSTVCIPSIYKSTQSNNENQTSDSFNDIKGENSIKIHPNPAKEYIIIESEKTIRSIEIYSMNGQKVAEHNIDMKNANINISSLSKGLYTLKIYTEEKIEIEKIIVE